MGTGSASAPSEADLRRLFEHTPVGMYRSTADGRFVFVNPALVRLLGYDSVEQVLALDLARDIYVDGVERERLVARYRAGGVIDGVEVKWKTRSGSELVVRIYGHSLTDGIEGFDATVFDITELRSAQTRLQITATTLQLLIGQLPAVVWTTDRDLRMTSSGGATREIFGSEPNATVGMTLYEYLRTDDATRPEIANHLRALAGETVSYDAEFGGRIFASRVGPQRDASGAIVGVIGTTIDVSASRALERRMVDAQRAESLGVLAGGLAHDFNNLLVAILGNADLAVRDSSGGRAALTNIRTAAIRAAELTQQLLAYAGGAEVGADAVAVAPVVDELLGLLGSTTPDNVTLLDDIGDDLPLVRADAPQLRQVVLNLVANARDAATRHDGSGRVRISARSEQLHEPGNHDFVLAPPAGRFVVLAVDDDGGGIDPDTRRRIFEPFFTTKPHGHGLGLAAVLGIVRAHGGGLRLDSSVGHGSRFEVWWPASDRTSTRLPTPVPTPVLNVLVVDDEDLVRDVLSRMVEDLGYAVIAVADGTSALALAERNDVAIDAVVLDLSMPHMGGRDVLAGLRQRRPDLPIVVCSGYDRDHGTIQGDGFLRKPFRIDDLERVLADVTRR